MVLFIQYMASVGFGLGLDTLVAMVDLEEDEC